MLELNTRGGEIKLYMPKIILHLCADTGSDTKPFQDDPELAVVYS